MNIWEEIEKQAQEYVEKHGEPFGKSERPYVGNNRNWLGELYGEKK